MQYVCDDNGSSQWFFDPENLRYHRLYVDRAKNKSIGGEHLPDPDFLLEKRLEAFSDKGHVNIEALKASPATCALWDHWNSFKSRDLKPQA